MEGSKRYMNGLPTIRNITYGYDDTKQKRILQEINIGKVLQEKGDLSIYTLMRSKRESTNRVFFPIYALCKPHERIFETYIRMKNIRRNPTAIKLEESFAYIMSKYELDRQPLENSFKQDFKLNKRNITKSALDPYFQRMRDLILELPESQRITDPYTYGESEESVKEVVSVISQYLSFCFKTGKEPSNFICTISFPIPSTTTNTSMRIYKRTIQLIKEGTRFDLYYGVYTMPEETGYPGTYKTILNLLPHGTSAGIFGLNASYISAGIYVYKPFEYSHHFISRSKSFGPYCFLGDLLQTMWPLAVVSEASSGGRRTLKRFKSANRTRKVS
jgi:hypothetical protein